jgi:hypothetical protein
VTFDEILGQLAQAKEEGLVAYLRVVEEAVSGVNHIMEAVADGFDELGEADFAAAAEDNRQVIEIFNEDINQKRITIIEDLGEGNGDDDAADG